MPTYVPINFRHLAIGEEFSRFGDIVDYVKIDSRTARSLIGSEPYHTWSPWMIWDDISEFHADRTNPDHPAWVYRYVTNELEDNPLWSALRPPEDLDERFQSLGRAIANYAHMDAEVAYQSFKKYEEVIGHWPIEETSVAEVEEVLPFEEV